VGVSIDITISFRIMDGILCFFNRDDR